MQSLKWWQHAVVYEIYPRSFQDSNGDGIGDLNGILSRLDYLVSLGVDALWITPIYPSPMADFGYDVANYTAIDPIFGTMDDFDRLLAEVHRRGLKLILDFVPNHTSDQHPWFLESRSSRTNPKRDWYLWRDQPNNWRSHFGGSAWEYDAHTNQYYLHEFLKEQPDLNWRNPAVKTAMFDALRFWLRKGVDGFRVDVMWLMIKDDQFRDNPPNPAWEPGQPENHRVLPVYDADRPEVHPLVQEMRAVLNEFGDRVLIGEIYLPVHQLMSYYGPDLTGANLPFNFHLLQCAWSAHSIAQVINDYYSALPPGAWPNWVLGNHDKPRIASRIGPAQARIAALLLLTLPGTLTLYYGEELGMCDIPIPPDKVQDPAEKNEPGIGQGRDPERTPMPWDATPLAGFTTGHPWLPITHDEKAHATLNVQSESADAASMLNLYRALIQLRRDHPVLISGKLSDVTVEDKVLRYRRIANDGSTPTQSNSGASEQIEVILNISHEEVQTQLPTGTVLAATHPDRSNQTVSAATQTLRPAEGLILQLDSTGKP